MKNLLLLISLFLVSCNPNSLHLEPCVIYTPSERLISSLPPAFPPVEPKNDVDKELYIGQELAKDLDLYRAITSFKRGMILLGPQNQEKRLQFEYSLALSYFLGMRYCDVLETIEGSSLRLVPDTFPAFRELSIMFYDAYDQTEQWEKASCIQQMLTHYDKKAAQDLQLYSVLRRGDVFYATQLIAEHPNCETIMPYLFDFHRCKKSVRKAQFLNAVLPGAGYYYVGQTKSAITSLILNTLFIAATVQFAQNDMIPAAIISGSIEMGWYIGGINGAGLAAKEYNERLYEQQVKGMMTHHRLFPVLMFQKGF